MKRQERNPKCFHDYMFLDKWQDTENTYWEFACRFCLNVKVIAQKNKNFSNDWKRKENMIT